jgi:hypothetical protein
MTSVLLRPRFVTPEPQVVLAYKPPESLVAALMTPEPLVLAVLPLGQLLPASVALEPPALAFTREPQVLTFVDRQQLVMAIRDLQPLVLAVLPLDQLLPASVVLEPLVVLAYKPLEPLVAKPLPLAGVNLKNLLVVRKNRSSSSPTGASSQIAPPGRSGIVFQREIKVSPV